MYWRLSNKRFFWQLFCIQFQVLKEESKDLPSWFFYLKDSFLCKHPFLRRWHIILIASPITITEAVILKLELQTNSWPGINISSLCWCMTQQHRSELVWEGGKKPLAFVFLVRGYGTAFMLMCAGGTSPGAPGCSVFCSSSLWPLGHPVSQVCFWAAASGSATALGGCSGRSASLLSSLVLECLVQLGCVNLVNTLSNCWSGAAAVTVESLTWKRLLPALPRLCAGKRCCCMWPSTQTVETV